MPTAAIDEPGSRDLMVDAVLGIIAERGLGLVEKAAGIVEPARVQRQPRPEDRDEAGEWKVTELLRGGQRPVAVPLGGLRVA